MQLQKIRDLEKMGGFLSFFLKKTEKN